MKKIFFIVCLVSSLFCADIVMCSYNRPMQLYALIESIHEKVNGVDGMFVVCRSDPEYQTGYDIVQKDFPNVHFFFQPDPPNCRCSFKPLILDSVYNSEFSTSKYVLFAMDDMLVADPIDLRLSEKVLENNPNIYAFFYRLGKNITNQVLTNKQELVLPRFTSISEDVYTWTYRSSRSDWDYSNNLDCTMYRKTKIQKALTKMRYEDPNLLEARWQGYRKAYGKAACHGHSKTVNIPMNVVTTSIMNPSIGNYTTKELNELFLRGKKMDIDSIDNSLVYAAHQDISFNFIARE